MDSTLSKGMITELECIKAFIDLGYHCSIPYGDCARYDVVVDIDNKLYRVQCKTSSWSTDTVKEKVAFEISTVTTTTNTKKTIRKTYSEDEVDFFYTCFNGESYLIPIAEIAGKTTFRIRYEYPSNNQKQGIHLASNYELKNQISKLKGEVVE